MKASAATPSGVCRKHWLRRAGVVLVVMGIACFAHIGFFFLRSTYLGARTLDTLHHDMRSAWQKSDRGTAPGTVRTGQPLGILTIPDIGLTAPVLEGTASRILSGGVGHLAASVLPGQQGTSVLAAHNVTWFRRLDQLPAGAKVIYRTDHGRYTFVIISARVMRDTAALRNSTGPTLVLEACYPLDALYLTPFRYVVTARLVKVTVSPATVVPRSRGPVGLATGGIWSSLVVPAGYSRMQVIEAVKRLPMGSIHIERGAVRALTSQEAGLQIADQMLIDWVIMMDSRSRQDTRQWLSIAPHVSLAPLNALSTGTARVGYQSLITIDLRAVSPRLPVVGTISATLVFPSGSYLVTLTTTPIGPPTTLRIQALSVVARHS